MPVEPRTFSDTEISQVQKLSERMTQAQIADFFGLSERTFRRICDRQPAVMTAYKKGKAGKIDYVAGKLMERIDHDDLTAIIFFLKTKAGWTEKQAMELTSPDGTMTPTRIERVFVDPSND